MNNTLIVVLGPTGIGKSAISIQLAKHLHCDIISADSRQIFKELAIGTAVPSPDELSQVRHHLIQHKSISDFYSASQFETEVGQLLPALFSKNHCAILTEVPCYTSMPYAKGSTTFRMSTMTSGNS
jgi:tRNA dimethylallyltransferase